MKNRKKTYLGPNDRDVVWALGWCSNDVETRGASFGSFDGGG